MTTLTADTNGVVVGKFTIPANLRAGAKSVVATGASGRAATGTFTGRGVIRTEERRRVTTITNTFYFVDPLAQTFTLNEGRHIAAVDLWFAVAGANDVIVQIRDTANGVPGQTVLAEKRVKPADIAASGTHTRVTFPSPVWLDAGRQFAIVVLTDSATASLHVAELGKFDTNSQKWITSQAYQVGVLLSSSNASTWTAHQDKDLAFRLLACKFTASSRTISLGSVSVTDCSDFLAEMNIDIPATGANAELRATGPGGEVYRMAPDKPLSLPSRVTGTVALSLILEGSEKASPVLYPGQQFIAGDMQASGTYVSRAFPCGTSARVSITFEAYLPGTSTVVVEMQKADLSWETVTLDDATAVGNGWNELVYVLDPLTATNTKIRLTLNGTAHYRPRIRKLRGVTTD